MREITLWERFTTAAYDYSKSRLQSAPTNIFQLSSEQQQPSPGQASQAAVNAQHDGGIKMLR